MGDRFSHRLRLSRRARKVLEFILASVFEKGLPPTIREIGQEFKISSTNGVRYYLGVLEKAGCIKRTGKISRGIEVRKEWIDSLRRESWGLVPARVPAQGRRASGMLNVWKGVGSVMSAGAGTVEGAGRQHEGIWASGRRPRHRAAAASRRFRRHRGRPPRRRGHGEKVRAQGGQARERQRERGNTQAREQGVQTHCRQGGDAVQSGGQGGRFDEKVLMP